MLIFFLFIHLKHDTLICYTCDILCSVQIPKTATPFLVFMQTKDAYLCLEDTTFLLCVAACCHTISPQCLTMFTKIPPRRIKWTAHDSHTVLQSRYHSAIPRQVYGTSLSLHICQISRLNSQTVYCYTYFPSSWSYYTASEETWFTLYNTIE